MRILLDTNILLWLLEGSPQLTSSQLQEINNNDNTVFVSIGSIWEIAIKTSLKKLSISYSVTEIIDRLRQLDLTLLPILPEHLVTISTLPFHHRDPFDRLFISQAVTENLIILTSDKIFSNYDVELL